MPTIMLSVHGGRGCNEYCRWHPDRLGELGPEDWHMGTVSDRSVIAIDDKGHLAGVWQYDRDGNKKVVSCGTWVAPKYRKKGIAKKMWEFGIAHEKPRKVRVIVITDRGYSLVQSIKSAFPQIKWDICEDGERTLRKLKK
jgi:predicted GNAT family acetyltransferase